MESFRDVVDSTDFFVASSTPGTCLVPLFGNDVTVSLGPTSKVPITEFALTVQGSALTQSDIGWIWLKFMECQSAFESRFSSTAPLRKAVAELYNALPPHPGYNAELTSPHPINTLHLGQLDSNVLVKLKNDGFVVVDGLLGTTASSLEKLSNFLVQKTGQEPSVRRDNVAFLNEEDATSCGLEQHFNLLLSIASHLNQNFVFPTSPYQPLAPGTFSKPLTNPKHIQAAEYGRDDFYVAHSDNSISESGIRCNFRSYTCILYCNEDWDAEDGGALRMYRASTDVKVPIEALKTCTYEDIIPRNGRLVIFDSKLVHAVERVLSNKRRRALTLWILRPENSGAKGETYYFGENEH